MQLLAMILVGLVACLHLWFLALEMFLWTSPFGRKVFGTKPEFANASRALAANQGLYNGFLSAGLFWSLWQPDMAFARETQVFFLSCVITAGAFGAATASRKILFVQAVPGALALAAVLTS